MHAIDWHYPEPRKGWRGLIDRFIGPGASNAEVALMLGVGIAAAVGVLMYAAENDLEWDRTQNIIAALLALDLFGGVVTNATASAKRWYHRKSQRFVHHFAFVAVHIIQPLLLVLLFRPDDWNFLLISYGYLLIASVVILLTPLHIQRPVAMIAFIGGILISVYILTPTPGFEWFLPIYYLKLLVSHLIREVPYR